MKDTGEWEDMKEYMPSGEISYVFLDGRGNPASSVYTKKGYLSDCQPIAAGGNALWHVIHEDTITFYTVDKNGTLNSSAAAFTGCKTIKKAMLVFTKIGPMLHDDTEAYFGLWYDNAFLKEDRDCVIRESEGEEDVDGCAAYTPKIIGVGYYYGTFSQTIEPISKKPELKYAKNTSSGIKLSWKKESGALGYAIYRKEGSGSYTKIKTISNRNTVSWTDTNVRNEREYTYYIKAYTHNGSQYIYTGKSNLKSAAKVTVATPALTSVKSRKSGQLEARWKKVRKASGYQIVIAQNSRFTKGKKTVNLQTGNASKTAFKKLNSKKTYYVRTRAYRTIGKAKYYSSWSKAKTVRIK